MPRIPQLSAYANFPDYERSMGLVHRDTSLMLRIGSTVVASMCGTNM